MLVKELIKSYREKKSWKQVDLADKLGVSQNYISKIELGLALPRSNAFKQKLAKVLEIPDQKLLEAYAESKLDLDECRAYQQMLYRSFLMEKKAELLSAQERALIAEFNKLSRRDRAEVLSYLKFKASGGEAEHGAPQRETTA
ncbi:MAG: helix-turn-helix transcriptional regulator [Candidatus Riflebacteria bacterium]|nr:helix-turn-helix transcriptional regulator [Candidatus Riflebacteria bacterium]